MQKVCRICTPAQAFPKADDALILLKGCPDMAHLHGSGQTATGNRVATELIRWNDFRHPHRTARSEHRTRWMFQRFSPGR
jgi:hypothetical protein